jgi:cytochrome bd-type quinol oxidase subunit 2
MGYLIGLPLAAWYLLGWIWLTLRVDSVLEDRIQRALAGATSGVLLASAVIAARARTHVGNTKWIQTRDGMEAVGDDIVLRGPDWAVVFMLVAAAGFAFWFSVSKRDDTR